MQKAGRLGPPGSVATGATETTIAGRRSAGNGEESFKPFSPNELKRGWHHIPKNSLSLRAGIQMAGRLGLPGSVATGGTETTIAGRRSAGNEAYQTSSNMYRSSNSTSFFINISKYSSRNDLLA